MQEFPNKPIRLVTVGEGGDVAMVARLIAQEISGPLGQPVIVDNLESSTSAAEFVARAPPDGYTLLHLGPSVWTAPLLKKVSYDPVEDSVPISLVVSQPNILVVHPSVEANSVKELIALARAKPGELAYASGLTGASSHIAGSLFTHMGGVDIVRIPYKNTPLLGVEALLAGKVQLMIFSAGSGMPHVRAGRLKALAVTSAEPSALTPGLPTMAATLPGYESVHVQSVFAPAKTPSTVIQRLNCEIVRFLNTAEAKQRLFSAGMEVVASTPEQCAAKVKSEMAILRKLIKEVGAESG